MKIVMNSMAGFSYRLLNYRWINISSSRSMHHRSWNIVRFDPDLKRAIELNTNIKIPTIQRPDDILVRVLTSSVNPLDIEMSRGYGNVLLSFGQQIMSYGISQLTYGRLPVTLGRDFVGQIIAKGNRVCNYKPGDIIWGTVSPTENGSHADYVITNENSISLKPRNLSNIDATTIPYVGLTAWSALSTFGGLNVHNCHNKTVLVLGGSGGVGCFAIQLLKFWNAKVIATCSPKFIQQLKFLTKVDECIDYNETEQFLRQYRDSFDCILDASPFLCAKKNYQIISTLANERCYKNANDKLGKSLIFDRNRTVYVTLSSPLLRNFDQNGLLGGTVTTITDALIDTLNGAEFGINFRWAYYLPNPKALAYIAQLVEQDFIKPYTSEVYQFDQALDAYEALEKKQNLMGKIVLNFK